MNCPKHQASVERLPGYISENPQHTTCAFTAHTRAYNSVTHAHIQHELADKRKRKRGWITNTTSSYTILSTSGLIYLTGKQSQLKLVSFFCVPTSKTRYLK